MAKDRSNVSHGRLPHDGHPDALRQAHAPAIELQKNAELLEEAIDDVTNSRVLPRDLSVYAR
jgi:hypothetical protein